tara:strand:+ start:70 stop:1662 length:1593 start_codon:yes stop_codon:yes gene_type:complete
MSSFFNFKRLTRGVKLLVDHIFDPITTALLSLTGNGISRGEYEKNQGTFRVNFNFPVANNFMSGPANTQTSLLTAPFILPPLQDEFGQEITSINNYELIEVSVGQDTRCEAAAIKSAVLGPTEVGGLQLGNAFAFSLSIKTKKREPLVSNDFNQEVFSMEIPEIALLNPYSRLNPHVQSGISIPFNYENSYLISITPKTDYSPVNLFVSLKFKSKLRQRDLENTSQNQTSFAARSFVYQPPSLPVADSVIKADTSVGINTNFKLIDSFIDRKFRGGFNRSGLTNYKEALYHDAGYEVISVPMFGSWPHVSGGPRYATPRVGNDLPFETLPWVNLASNLYTTMDRAVIPINYPLTVHHVIVAMNYTGGSGERVERPTNAVAPSLKHEVGVGLMSGNRSDNIEHQQVAYVSWLPSTIDTYRIDKIDFNQGGAPIYGSNGYSWDLINCPLVLTNGVGYTPQGKPVFLASGTSANSTRTDLAGTPPPAKGGEQVLEIRWKISNGTDNPASWTSRQSILGYGGCWVYLICKKTVI